MSEGDAYGTAAMRLSDGEMVYVDGLPVTARAGDVARFRGSSGEQTGIIAISSSLLVWCCAEIDRAVFVALEPQKAIEDTGDMVMLADLRSVDSGPSDDELAGRLRLARVEMRNLGGA
jgi:hypothetical protein